MIPNMQQVVTVPLEAQTPVELLEGITPNEVRKLQAAGIYGLNDLWLAMVAHDLKLSEIERLAARTKISSERLVELLPGPLFDLLYDELLRRADDLGLDISGAGEIGSRQRRTRNGVRRRVSHRAKRSGPWIRRHLLDLIFIFGVLSLTLLAVRATGLLDSYYPSSFGLNPSVVITQRDLKAGEVINVDRDLSYSRFTSKKNYFESTSTLVGLILKRNVSAQKPLRWEDVLRYQVVATRDIAPGETIPADAVNLHWSTYDPTAMLELENVKGHKSRHAIRKDSVILQTAVLP